MSFDFFKFPAGEVHCKDKNLETSLMLYVPFEEGDNLNDYVMKIMLAAETRQRDGYRMSLFLPYLPYSRQDRPTSRREPFSLKVIGNMLNLNNFYEVLTLDVHSDVAYGCIDRLVNIPVTDYMHYFNFGLNPKSKMLVIPDAGAFKRLSKLSEGFKGTVIALKDRDISNGHLEIKHVVGDVEGQDCLIVDDICDGGGTFILLANELYKLGAKSVDLMVTHGIFSKGLLPLNDAGIRNIYTTDSFPQEHNTVQNSNIYVLNCMKMLSDYCVRKYGSFTYES